MTCHLEREVEQRRFLEEKEAASFVAVIKMDPPDAAVADTAPKSSSSSVISTSAAASTTTAATTIYTGVPIHEYLNHRDIAVSLASPLSFDAETDAAVRSFQGDDNDSEQEDSAPVAVVMDQAVQQQNKFQVWSFACGLLIGGFIQLSSLGANYMLLELYEIAGAGSLATSEDSSGSAPQLSEMERALQDTNSTTVSGESVRSHVLTFSLMWSIITSLMGVAVLLLVRGLVLWQDAQEQEQNQIKNHHHRHRRRTTTLLPSLPVLLTHLECSFAVGTLLGLCMVCILTDFLLGCSAHLGHSFMTLCVAMLWSKLLLVCANLAKDDVVVQDGEQEKEDFSDDDGDSHLLIKHRNTLTQPLLPVECHSADENDSDDDAPVSFYFRFTSLVLGLFIGFFTQLSSLGANFLLAHWQVPRDSHAIIFWTSLAWALVTSLMGIFVMILVRGLVVLSSSKATASTDLSTESSSCSYLQNVILHLECSFAVGALVGVNVAWMVTDLILGMRLHLTHSLVSLIVALIWCQSVVFCVRCRRNFHNKQKAERMERSKLLGQEAC